MTGVANEPGQASRHTKQKVHNCVTFSKRRGIGSKSENGSRWEETNGNKRSQPWEIVKVEAEQRTAEGGNRGDKWSVKLADRGEKWAGWYGDMGLRQKRSTNEEGVIASAKVMVPEH